MELFLQLGYGMKQHCKTLIKEWGAGSVILSPRDMSSETMCEFSKSLIKLGGASLLDPQFYNPHANHPGILQHANWDPESATEEVCSEDGAMNLVAKLKDENDAIGTSAFILPSLFCKSVTQDFLDHQAMVADISARWDDKPRYATICLSNDVVKSSEQLAMIADSAGEWDVDGYYVVAEHPSKSYLVDDPAWMANFLQFCFELKSLSRTVCVGYTSPQMLLLACAKVDAIATGTWQNVRSFNIGKFDEPEPDSITRKKTWYYAPDTYAEYPIPFLQIAYKMGVLNKLKPSREFRHGYADQLFRDAPPEAVRFGDREAFLHYLSCMRRQSELCSLPTFKERVSYALDQLVRAKGLNAELKSKGVSGQARDFTDIYDVNIAALKTFEHGSGFIAEQNWNQM